MPKIISNHELDHLLFDLLHSQNCYWNEVNYYFQDLYVTGCRSNEVLQLSKWSRVQNVYILKTAKTEKLRIFEPLQLSAHFRHCLEFNEPIYGGLTYDQLTREFRRLFKLVPIWSGERIADTYLFRYNRARLHFKETGDLNKTMEFFGWQSAEVASKYITTPLIYDPFKRLYP